MTAQQKTPAEIYLVPDTEHGLVWSHDPAPGEGMKAEEAVKYVRADLAQSNEMLANRIVELTNERDAMTKRVSEQSKVIEHIASAVGEVADPMACWESVDALIQKAESLEQEAKIHASELDTQKSIVRDLCNLFGLRVHDYHCVSKVKEALASRDADAIDQHTRILVDAIMSHSVPVQYYDANVRMRDALVNVITRANQIRQSAKAGS